LVIRLSAERPEAVKTGFARVFGVEKNSIVDGIKQILEKKGALPKESTCSDGTAARKIVEILENSDDRRYAHV
jgi:UDP-N-acetylglucosamine 2-epimerase